MDLVCEGVVKLGSLDCGELHAVFLQYLHQLNTSAVVTNRLRSLVVYAQRPFDMLRIVIQRIVPALE